MLEKITFVTIVFSFGLLIFILYLVRTKRLRLQYSLLWLLTVVIMIVFSCFRFLLDRISFLIGIYYPPTLLFLVAFLFLLIIVLHYSVVISNLYKTNKALIQKFGIMNYKLEELEKKINDLHERQNK